MLLKLLKDKLNLYNDPLKTRLRYMMYKIQKSLPTSELRSLFKKHCFLAGGAIRCSYLNEPIKDWDIFFKSKEACDLFIALLGNTSSNFKFKSQHTYTIEVDGELVQFCLGQYSGDPDEVISKFDYTNSMAYYDLENDNLNLTEKFKHACDNKLLEFNENAYSPKVAAQRFNNFTTVGWDYGPSAPLKIVQSMGSNKGNSSFGE